MEKNNGKIVAVVALAIAVVALSIGFAAFSATLTIGASSNIIATNEFTDNVNYVADSSSCVYTGGSTAATGSDAGTPSGKSWSGVYVKLDKDHKSVTCQANILNASTYAANLKSISGSTLTCGSAGSGDAIATNAATICGTVGATVALKTDTTTFTTTTGTGLTTGSVNIAAGATETVYLTVAYTSEAIPDGDIAITIPSISLLFKTN
jgi:hypothetical protein